MSTIYAIHTQPTYVAPGAPAPPQPSTLPTRADSLEGVQQVQPPVRGIDVTV